jgi:Fe2+ transport system protein FeoA
MAPVPDPREMSCGLCGVSFLEDRGQPACLGCPLARACHYVRCPHCGYENPVVPRWLGGLRRAAALTGGRGAARIGSGMEAEPVTLADLTLGQEATVVGLVEPGSADGRALAGLGVLPGATVAALQRYPAWIVRVDHAEIALDDALASQIRVRTVAPRS